MIKLPTLLLTVLIPTLACAEAYFTVNFANSIPSTFTLCKADGGQLQTNIYNNIGNDLTVSWIAGQLDNGYGRCALSPTRNAEASLAADNWMILPSIRIADSEAVIRWEARSLHKHIAETYRVAIRESGTDNWTDVYSCDGESYAFTTRCASLSGYHGKDVDIAFVATTQHGFILAVDNIFVGVPDDDLFVFESTTPHYVGEGDANTISGILTYYGHQSDWSEVQLTIGNETQSVALPQLSCGESTAVEFMISPVVGETYNYTIAAVGENKQTTLHSDFLSCSYYSRTHLLDRCSGTWCLNCPTAELTTSRLERIYGDQMIILEAHVNDYLTNQPYWDSYLSEFIFSIPAFVPNHDQSKVAWSIKSTDKYQASLDKETIARIKATATEDGNGEIRVTSEVELAQGLDNTADRYRVAYMLIADVHDPYTPQYLQKSQALTYRDEQYYYQPDYILPEMMYFDNVPVDATVGYSGVPCSMPTTIAPGTVYNHEYSMQRPMRTDFTNVRAIAMVVDIATGLVLNADIATPSDTNASVDIDIDGTPYATELYDLTGRRIHNPGSGIYIALKGNSAYKILNNKITNR